LLLAIVVLQAITGAHTPACLSAAYDPVETVTPPYCWNISRACWLVLHIPIVLRFS